MKPIANALDLDDARSQPQAFVFIWVNWAGQARQSEIVVRQLVDSWGTDHPECPAPAYRADLSDQEGEVWEAVRDWLRAEGRPVDQLAFGGGGALLLVRAGSIVLAVPYAAGIESRKLMAATASAFGSGAEGIVGLQ